MGVLGCCCGVLAAAADFPLAMRFLDWKSSLLITVRCLRPSLVLNTVPIRSFAVGV